VAAFDAVFIGAALVVLGVPLALPLAVLTFFGAFVPIVGALATGMAAVLVALVSGGLDLALATTAAVIVVQQVESHVLHPLVIGRALSVHPRLRPPPERWSSASPARSWPLRCSPCSWARRGLHAMDRAAHRAPMLTPDTVDES
jgi:hypothetical protein